MLLLLQQCPETCTGFSPCPRLFRVTSSMMSFWGRFQGRAALRRPHVSWFRRSFGWRGDLHIGHHHRIASSRRYAMLGKHVSCFVKPREDNTSQYSFRCAICLADGGDNLLVILRARPKSTRSCALGADYTRGCRIIFIEYIAI